MDNEALKQVFKNLHAKITKNVNPDNAIDELLANDIITDGDYDMLLKVPDPKARCRHFMSLLYSSTHSETFIQLREALLDEYPQIVDEIDKQRTSLTTSQPHRGQSHMSQSTEGKIPLSHYSHLLSRYRICTGPHFVANLPS